VRDALLLVDLIQDFQHDDGDRLLESYRSRHPAMVAAIDRARQNGIPLVYANDNWGRWDSNVARLVEEALAGPGADLVEAVAPRPGDCFVVKPRYSAFDHTPLDLILRDLDIQRILLAGAATEMCVVQTAIDAREEGLKVTILANACATTDERMEQLAFEYAERVVGAVVERG
jgi:nicotinamidase-related amidase